MPLHWMQEERRLPYVHLIPQLSYIELCLDAPCVVAAVVKLFSSDKVKISGSPKKYTQTQGTSSGKPAYRYFCGECGSPTHAEGDIVPGMSAVRLSLFSEPPPAPVGEGFWRNAAGAASRLLA